MRKTLAHATALLPALILLAGGPASAFTYQLTTLADTTTPAGDGFDLMAFSIPTYAAGTFVFAAMSVHWQEAIYSVGAAGGALTKLVDTATEVPGGTGPFTGNDTGYLSAFKPPGACASPAVGKTWVSFFGYDETNGYGLYAVRRSGGKVVKLADPNTPYPDALVDGTTNYSGFCVLSENRDTVSFDAAGGVYGAALPGAAFRTADTNTPDPSPPSPVTRFLQPSVSGANVAYVGADAVGPYAIYGGPTTSPGTAIVTTAAADPRGKGTLSQFWNPVLSGNKVVFSARTENVTPPNEGIYTTPIGGAYQGQVALVADLRSPVPGAKGGAFTELRADAINQQAVNGRYVAFVAQAEDAKQNTVSGLYESCKGTLSKVLTVGDVLPDGDTVRAVWGLSPITVIAAPGGGTADLFGVTVDGNGQVGTRLYAVTRSPAC